MSQRAPNAQHTLIPVIPVDILIHTSKMPVCYDPTCPCHKDKTLIARIYQAYLNGEVTAQEAANIVNGKTV